MSPVNCHDARTLLMAYLDSELDAATTVSVREHLRTCSTCAVRFDQEEHLETALAALLREGTMPADVCQRLDSVLVAASREREADGDGAASGMSGDVPRSRDELAARRGVYMWRWIAAAALVLVAVTLMFTDNSIPREQAPAYVGHFVSSWESAAARRAAPTVPLPAQDAAGVRAMLTQADLSAFEFPGDGRVHDHAVHLLGAREESFDGVRVVNVLYDCCGALTSVFVLQKHALDALPGGYEALRGPADLEVDGVHTHTVERDGLLIGVVSRHASGLAEQWSG
jgi:anti-sigma factor RsiW